MNQNHYHSKKNEKKKNRRKKRLIRLKDMETMLEGLITPDTGRLVDPFEDSEEIRLTALNLELAAKNLLSAGVSPSCLVLTAELCSHKLVATPDSGNEIKVMVYEL
jgi:hypothetical protein